MSDPARALRRKAYAEKLKDPRWQRKRLEILERDEWACVSCYEDTETLHVHHRYYLPGKDPWEAPPEALVTLCETCHEEESKQRPDVERRLLMALRERFLWHELSGLAGGMENLEVVHLPEVVTCAIGGLLSDSSRVRKVVGEYLDSIPRNVVHRDLP